MMEIVKTLKGQLLEERRKNAALTAQLMQANADIAYLAMMTDFEIENVEEAQDEQELQ